MRSLVSVLVAAAASALFLLAPQGAVGQDCNTFSYTLESTTTRVSVDDAAAAIEGLPCTTSDKGKAYLAKDTSDLIVCDGENWTKVQPLVSRVAAVESSVSALEGSMSTVEPKVTALEGSMSTVEGAVSTLETNLAPYVGKMWTDTVSGIEVTYEQKTSRTRKVYATGGTDVSKTIRVTLNGAGGSGHFQVQLGNSHCGGGCHGGWGRRTVFTNSYTSMYTLDSAGGNIGGSNAGSELTVIREDPGGDGNAEHLVSILTPTNVNGYTFGSTWFFEATCFTGDCAVVSMTFT